jgi:alanine racemase
VAVGDEAVLIGAQGGDRIRAEDWAELLGTINYEIVTGLAVRLPRLYRATIPVDD